jgi:hypothetical protein
MKLMSQWETVRHQAAIYGWVSDLNEKPLANVLVSIVDMPSEFSNRLSMLRDHIINKNELVCGTEKTRTRADGGFFFLDLPKGKYTLKAVDTSSGMSDQQEAEVVWDKNQIVKRVLLRFKMVAKTAKL